MEDREEERESFLFHQEADVDGIPPSLLSYFETSKSRAAACERLILEELEDFTASHPTEDSNSPTEAERRLNQKVICDAGNEEINTSSDTGLLPAPTDIRATFTPSNEDETEADERTEGERRLAFEVVSLNEEERKESSEYEAERERRYHEETEREERQRQIERDFQEELRRIMEAEKLHQQELELMERRAQEKLEEELQLQQELIGDLKRRVEEERRKREEEQKRIKDEEDRRKREEEKMKMEAERRRMEEEMRRTEERRMEEVQRKKEEERKKEEQEKRRVEREEKRKREEERKRLDLEKKKLEEETRKMKEEEERKNREEMERVMMEAERKREEERRKEEVKKKTERRKTEEEMSRKKDEEDERKREEEKIKAEEERKRMEEEMRRKKERRIEEVKLIKEEEKKKEEQEKRKREEERKRLDLEKKKLEEETRKMKEEEKRKSEEERKNDEAKEKTEKRKVEQDVSMRKEEECQTKEEGEERKKRENMRIEGKLKETIKKKEEEEDGKKMCEETRKSHKREHGDADEEIKLEEKMMVKEAMRKGGGENSKKKEELRPIKEDERRKQEGEWRTKEEEMRRQHDEEDSKKSEEEMKENNNRTMESKIKDKEEKQEEEEEEKKQVKEELRRSAEGEKGEIGTNKKDRKTGKEIGVKAKEEGKMRGAEENEKKTKVGKATELQEKRENSSKRSVDKTETTEDWTSGLGSLHSESTVDPVSRETIAPSIISALLPEHTEQRRLSWMKDCVPWSKLSLQNRRKQRRSVQSGRGRRRVSEAGVLPPLCPNALLESAGRKSLQEVTSVTLQDLPGCSLSSLAQCAQLRSLTLRRCGLKSLEDINKLAQLCYIDVQENNISFIDCENMTSLRVLRLARNKLTSIHGLSGAENLDVLDLSHNSITRIAGLESVRRLQRLSIDHNQLISTKGLKDVYTLLHLNCSHNHLVNVEGLESSALLNTLDLRANSLTEPPRLKNHVLLRELHLDDNSISSLLDLTACWLPLLQHLSVAQNRITQLPSMSDSVSLTNLDLRFNCISELQNVCVSLEGCRFLREVRLAGNPLQQESGWRCTLQTAVPGLRAMDDQETGSFASPPAVQQLSPASGSFLTFCQAQLQQTRDLKQRHGRELSNASSSLDAVETSCRHLAENLQLAEDQRFAHEYGDTAVADKQTGAEETLDWEVTNIEKCTELPEMESNGKAPPLSSNRDNMRCSAWTFEEKSASETQRDTFAAVAKTEQAIKETDSQSVHSLATKAKTIPSDLKMASVSNHQNLHIKNTAAVVIQQLWRKYRQKCGNISSPSTAERGGGRGGDGGEPESGPSRINRSQDDAAAVIQAFWRGFALRRRLASALAAATRPDAGEDDTFEEVDVDEFVFDEAALEKPWTLSLSEDSLPLRYSVLEQPLSLKPPEHFPEPSQYTAPPPLAGRSKQAWVSSAGQRVSAVSSDRSKSPASPSVVGGVSERSEKILEEWGFTHSHTALLMLKRAQNMKSKKHQQRKRRDPSVRLALLRNCSYQAGPGGTPNRKAHNGRRDEKEQFPRLSRALGRRRGRSERGGDELRPTQRGESSESECFLPEISSDVLNGGRVQLVADPGYTERPHHASGLWANRRFAAQPRRENNYPRRNSLGHARKDAPSPKRVTSAPSKTERISFRDNPVQLSAGWGGGKKRDKVLK